MYALRGTFLRVFRTPKKYINVNHIECERKFLSTILCRSFASSRNDGLYSQTAYEDDDDVSFSDRPARSNYGQKRQSYSRNNSSFKPRRNQFSEFDEFDGENEDPYNNERSYRQQGFQSSRFSDKVFGANIQKKVWDTSRLPALEKNFYVEHPSLTKKSKEEIDAFYKDYNIVVQRGERPIPVSHFSEANFPEEINQQLLKNAWTQPTPIQSLGWPLALSGKNMVGIAQTGSGKTLGFILPALVHIKHQRQVTKGEGPIVLVMAPTRELAQQIKGVAVEYCRPLGVRSCCLFGGQSKVVQGRHLSEGPEIVVATPGRLLDFMEMGAINLDRTSYLVLDEADRMLDMGFEPQIRKVLEQIRPDRQTLMWSATWPPEIQQLAHDFLGEFTQVNIGSVDLRANPNIQQIVQVCERRDKIKLLTKELENAREEGPQKTLIFSQTKTQSDFLTMQLKRLRFKAMAIHGDKSQLVRDQTLKSFKTGDTEILVATDVASRGLDVNDIKLVINFDYPNSIDDYIHRIGRTARAAKTGTALTFITSEDAGKVNGLIKVLKEAGQNVPEELTELVRYQGKSNTRGKFFKIQLQQTKQVLKEHYSRLIDKQEDRNGTSSVSAV